MSQPPPAERTSETTAPAVTGTERRAVAPATAPGAAPAIRFDRGPARFPAAYGSGVDPVRGCGPR
jgi:hypothetical protein